MSDSVDVIAIALGRSDLGIVIRTMEAEIERRKERDDQDRRWEYQYLVDHLKRQRDAQTWP